VGSFQGFGPQALAFFEALAFHQSRDWFEANRGLYESDVKQPMGLLIEDLAAILPGRGIPLAGDAKRSLFRLNRDVRFAKDKSPYKTQAGAVMTRSGSKSDPGLLYVHVAPQGCFAAAGFYMPEPEQLAALREAIRARPAAFQSLEKALAKSGLQLSGDSRMTRLPRGFEDMKESPVAGALRLKSFTVSEPLDAGAILRPELVETVAAFAGRALPLLAFGWAALDRRPSPPA